MLLLQIDQVVDKPLHDIGRDDFAGMLTCNHDDYFLLCPILFFLFISFPCDGQHWAFVRGYTKRESFFPEVDVIIQFGYLLDAI